MSKQGLGLGNLYADAFCISILPLLGAFTDTALVVSSTDRLVQELCIRLLQCKGIAFSLLTTSISLT